MKRELVFVINNAAFFVSHRLPLAISAREAGWNVHLLIGQAGSPTLEPASEKVLLKNNISYTRLPFRTVGMNPFVEVLGFIKLCLMLAKLRPSVVHTASPKGTLYGGLAARLLRVPALVIAISGMGFLYTGKGNSVKQILKRLYAQLMNTVFRHPNATVIVQNLDDQEWLIGARLLSKENGRLIPGSGVDLDLYRPGDCKERENVVVLPARLLRDKGVEEFVSAARIARESGCTWRFALVGTADYANPSAISASKINSWVDSGLIEWWGHRNDMPEVFAKAGIVCLPSYREGMPKCLLEAAASGCPVVTTDVTGCREAITPGITGDLVPVEDAEALATTLLSLIADAPRRARYGTSARLLATQKFGIESVVVEIMDIYEDLIKKAISRDRFLKLS